MAAPQLRIFPHSPKEFPSEDSLRIWLLGGLRGRGGLYHLLSADRVAELPPGSVVLFRYGQRIIGEAVVSSPYEVLAEKARDKTTYGGEEEEYAAQVTFAPSSVRLYAPPLPLEQIEQYTDKDLRTYAGVYPILTWDIYAHVLEWVASRGAFIS